MAECRTVEKRGGRRSRWRRSCDCSLPDGSLGTARLSRTSETLTESSARVVFGVDRMQRVVSRKSAGFKKLCRRCDGAVGRFWKC
jgi:hypothetical protein